MSEGDAAAEDEDVGESDEDGSDTPVRLAGDYEGGDGRGGYGSEGCDQ
jgi:hypothetical protein